MKNSRKNKHMIKVKNHILCQQSKILEEEIIKFKQVD